MRAFTRYCLIFCALLMAGAAQARDYQVEVLLFETVAGRDLTAGGLYYPETQGGLRLGSEEAVAAGFVPLELNLSLAEDAASIAGSRRYRLIRHLAWRQPGLDDENALPVQVNIGTAFPVYLPDNVQDFDDFIPASLNPTAEFSQQVSTSTVAGSITVRLGRFLHVDARLVYTDEETQQSFRLLQSRKMRSRELHYIDNPRFGLLTRILPLEDPQGSSDDAELADDSIDDAGALE